MRRLILPSLLSMLALCATTRAQSQIFIVRHAEKAEATSDTKDPELSERGRARADSLGNMLKDAGLTAIYATEFKRTQQTAQAVAKLAAINVTIIKAQETEALTQRLLDRRDSALVVAHSNTLPAIITGLGVRTPVTVAETDYDNLFIVIRDPEPRVIRLHY
jgi:broad specificity phosphatase PhoE